jgi:RND family efflux transporter MFP subunit
MRPVALLLAMGSFALLAACERAPEAPAAVAPRPVLTTRVAFSSSETIGLFIGTVAAQLQSPLGFQLSGRLLSRDVGVGDLVTKGQSLASLDAAVQQFQLSSDEAAVASAQAQSNTLAASEERIRALVDAGTYTQAQLDSAVTAQKTAEAQLQQAQASLARSRDQVSYTRILASYDGVVVSVGAEVGQVVSAGQTIVTIARPDQRDAVFDMPEQLAVTLKVGDAVNVGLVGDDPRPTTGHVREIAPAANTATRAQRIKVGLDDPGDGYRLGTLVTVSITRPDATPVAELPATAIRRDNNETSVWVVDRTANTVSRKMVQLAPGATDPVHVTGGIANGDEVVIAGVNSLSDREKVRDEAPGVQP